MTGHSGISRGTLHGANKPGENPFHRRATIDSMNNSQGFLLPCSVKTDSAKCNCIHYHTPLPNPGPRPARFISLAAYDTLVNLFEFSLTLFAWLRHWNYWFFNLNIPFCRIWSMEDDEIVQIKKLFWQEVLNKCHGNVKIITEYSIFWGI